MCTVQGLGMFTVMLTTIGCLYFGRQPMVSSSGQNAIGILIFIVNASFVLSMVIAIARAGRHEIMSALELLKSRV